MKRILAFIITISILIVQMPFVKSDDGVNIFIEPSNTTPVKGDTVSFTFSANSSVEQNIAIFRIHIKFDTSKLLFKSLSPSDGFSKSEFKSNLLGDTLTIIYLTSQEGFSSLPHTDIEIFEIKFKILETASFGDTSISAEIDGIADDSMYEVETNQIEPSHIEISPVTPSDCTIKTLEPSEGTLYPNFNPNIKEYYIEVGSSVHTIEFFTETTDPNASIKINRRTLNKAGTATSIKITVTSPSGKDKLVYCIAVDRLYPDTESDDSSKKTSKSSAASRTSRDKHTSNSGDDKFTDDTNSFDNIDDLNSRFDRIKTSNPNKNININKDNFTPFLVGLSLCAIILAAAYFILRFKKYKKNKNKF